ncbi:MAG: hypothetical protein P9M06_00105 [Candidatus Saelkia tenebricola]|nr:hypothetical protein [Candidatus Saelkia tenebricola]
MNFIFTDKLLNANLLLNKCMMKSLKFYSLLFLCLLLSSCKSFKTEIFIKEEALNYQKEGRFAQDKKDWSKAISYYKKATYLDPYNAKIYNDLGIIYEVKEMYSKAEDTYKKAIDVDEKFLSSYFNLARLYEKMDNAEKAVHYYKLRVKYSNKKDDPWVWRAQQRIQLYEPINNE